MRGHQFFFFYILNVEHLVFELKLSNLLQLNSNLVYSCRRREGIWEHTISSSCESTSITRSYENDNVPRHLQSTRCARLGLETLLPIPTILGEELNLGQLAWGELSRAQSCGAWHNTCGLEWEAATRSTKHSTTLARTELIDPTILWRNLEVAIH